MTGDPAPQNQGRGPQYRGMRRSRVNPQTGQRETEVWVQGQGYLPEGSIATLAEEDQAQLSRARNLLGTARNNARLGQQFADVNKDYGTGGLGGLPVPDFAQSADRQRLEGITNQMVRTNIQPGQAGTMNSIIEQMLARQQYPTTGTYGGVNTERTIGLMVDEAEILAMTREAEEWARRNRGLQGFDVHWTENRSDQIRQEADRVVRQRLRQRYGQSPGRQAPGRTQQRSQPTRVDIDGNPIR